MNRAQWLVGSGFVAMLALSACGSSGPTGGAAGHGGGGASGGAAGAGGGAAGGGGGSAAGGDAAAGAGGGAAGAGGGAAGAGGGTAGAGGGTADAAAGTGGGGAAGTNADGGAGTAGAPNDGGAGATDASSTDTPTDGAAGADGGSSFPAGAPLPLCVRIEDCAAGSSCVFYSTQLGPVEGHCVPDGTASGLCKTTGAACGAGLACDPLGYFAGPPKNRCAPAVASAAPCGYDVACADSACLGGSLTTTALTGTCVAPGALNGACRAAAPRCDTGLGCTAAVSGVCATLATTTCGTAGCPDGTDCATASHTCIAPGASGGLCRSTGPACDTGLACSAGKVCVVPVAVGAFCASGTCPTGSSCRFGLCTADGTSGASCMADGSCNAGLSCTGTGLCEPTASVVADGMSCGSAFCNAGSECAVLTHVCAPFGSVDTACSTNLSLSPHPCAAGLFCSQVGTCADPAQALPAGSTCMFPNVCAPGTTCLILTSTTGTCRAPGAAGGPCRPLMQGATQCDTGLGCYAAPATGTIVTCQPETLSAGMACNPNSTTAHCIRGLACSSNVCVAPGKLGGACRTHDPNGPCDALLACNGGCTSGLAEGAACVPTGTPRCALPDICVTVGANSTCAAAGYTEDVVPTLAFIDACTSGSHIPLRPAFGASTVDARFAGHATTPINLPFAFRFWGSDQTQVWPSTKGFLKFGAENQNDFGVGNGYLPSDSYGPLVAPFWDDLVLGEPPASDICYAVTGAAPSRKFIVEWLHARRYGVPGSDLDFEIVINETTKIVELAYHTLAPAAGADASWADGSRASIGLQSGYDSVAIRHEGAVVAGGGLRYTPR